MSYDPMSTDAMFSKIIERLDHQDAVLRDIKEQVYKTNGRVNELERDKWMQRGAAAVISVMAVALWNWLAGK